MSIHTFKTTLQDRDISVRMGWDRPLQGFFMCVLYTDIPEDDYNADEWLYTNLNEPPQKAFTASMVPWVEKLTELGITLPNSIVAMVESDKTEDRGNHFVEHWLDDEGNHQHKVL